jgi:protein-tyrosine phosphatase
MSVDRTCGPPPNRFAVAPGGGFVQFCPPLPEPPPMTPFWIETTAPGRLATSARPRAGELLRGEMLHAREEGADVVVSLLDPREVMKLGLEMERDFAVAAGLEFLSFPVPDHGLPQSPVAVSRLVSALARKVLDGSAVVLHCRAGIGRSSLIAALVLMHSEPRVNVDKALARISLARGLNVPDTEAQRAWLHAFRMRL